MITVGELKSKSVFEIMMLLAKANQDLRTVKLFTIEHDEILRTIKILNLVLEFKFKEKHKPKQPAP